MIITILGVAISSLLHFFMMVIAGLYLAILLCVSINVSIYIYLFDFHYLILHYYPLFISTFTIIMSSICSLFIIDIKSIIAFSTIGQIAYILLNLYISSSLSLSHIFIHSFYKCLLFLLAGELIHNYLGNWQSIYIYYSNNSLIRGYYIIAGIALIFASTKEGILHATIIVNIFLYALLLLSTTLSILYILFIFIFILFYNSRISISLSIFGFTPLLLIIMTADKSFHYSITVIDYPHSSPHYISVIISSIGLLLYYLLTLLFNCILTLFYLWELFIYLSFPYHYWSPNFFSIHYIQSANFYRFPTLIFDLFGRFRAFNIIFIRSELLSIFVISTIVIMWIAFIER